MAWYRTGTIAVTNGSTTVTGTGTDWLTNAASGEGVLAPDGKIYEIANITAAGSITLGSAYLGATASGQTYVIVPTQSYIRDLASQAAALVASYATIADEEGAGRFDDGTVSVPGLRFINDDNTGLHRAGADDLRLVAGGVSQAKITTAGFDVIDSKFRITGSADATKIAVFEVDGLTTATTRTYTLPDASTTLVGIGTTQTLTGKTIDTASNTLKVNGNTVTASSGTATLTLPNSTDTLVGRATTDTLTNKTLTSPVLVTPALGTPSSGVVTNLTGTASININGTVGATTPNTGAFTTLSTTGNVTLGDAVSDTVTISGYAGIGSINTANLFRLTGSGGFASTTQVGVNSSPTGTSAGTTALEAFSGALTTATAAYTVADVSNFRAVDATKGSGSTITNLHGLRIADLTQGTNNYGITSAVSSGTNKWNIYASGTAQNAFAGNVRIGSTSAPTVALDVTGAATVSGAVTGASFTVTLATVPACGIFLPATNILGFATGSSEKMRIDSSGNLAIGLTSPSQKLDVQGNARLRGSTGASAPILEMLSSGFWTWGVKGDGHTLKFQYDSNVAFQIDAANSGAPIFNAPTTASTLGANGNVTIERTSNTQLTFKMRGSDGVTRSGSITLA